MFSTKPSPYPDLQLTIWQLRPSSSQSPQWLRDMMQLDVDTIPKEAQTNDEVKQGIRQWLRHDGFKPRGRDKPASEALRGAVAAARLGPHTSINTLVDLCNVVSMHSGLPISVVDTSKLNIPPDGLTFAACPAQTEYVFNPSGQIINVSHLLCLHDADGPCASPVKDAQRTKTDDLTNDGLLIFWCPQSLSAHAQHVQQWCGALLESLDITIDARWCIGEK